MAPVFQFRAEVDNANQIAHSGPLWSQAIPYKTGISLRSDDTTWVPQHDRFVIAQANPAGRGLNIGLAICGKSAAAGHPRRWSWFLEPGAGAPSRYLSVTRYTTMDSPFTMDLLISTGHCLEVTNPACS